MCRNSQARFLLVCIRYSAFKVGNSRHTVTNRLRLCALQKYNNRFWGDCQEKVLILCFFRNKIKNPLNDFNSPSITAHIHLQNSFQYLFLILLMQFVRRTFHRISLIYSFFIFFLSVPTFSNLFPVYFQNWERSKRPILGDFFLLVPSVPSCSQYFLIPIRVKNIYSLYFFTFPC